MEALIKSLLLFIALFALCQANALQGTSGKAEENVLLGLRRFPNSYYLYTSGSNDAEYLTVDNIAATNFDVAAKTIVIIHDKSANTNFDEIQLVRINYMRSGPYNVICMDWSAVAYMDSDFIVNNSEFVAQGLTDLIRAIIALPDMDRKTIHIIGFGLGAHIAGMASSEFAENKIGRITGLDPGTDGGRWTAPHRLTKSNALYVDVIHTDGSGINANGMMDNIGHVDFYPNGGISRQPGCTTNACSHARAVQLYLASFHNQLTSFFCQTITAMTLNSCDANIPLKMDGLTPETYYLPGIYRLTTGSTPPF